MINRVLTVAVVVIGMMLSGCAGGYVATYDIALVEAERPAKAAERYGKHVINNVDERGTEVCYFEDDLVQIAWVLTAKELSFVVTNKSDHTIEIIWDEAAYEDEAGVSHRVVHSGVTLSNPDKPQKPTRVEARERVSDSVRSLDNIHYQSGVHGDWREVPFFPTSGKTDQGLTADAEQYVGKTVKVVLPLRTSAEAYNYVFVFKVDGVDIKKAGKQS